MTPRQTDAALAAALRAVAEAIVTPETVRREREHDGAIRRDGRVKGERVAGRLPPNAAGAIQAGSVQVPASAMSPAESLADHLTDVEAEVATKLTSPLTGAGGLILGGAGGAATELPPGAEGRFLGIVGGKVGYYSLPEYGYTPPTSTQPLFVVVGGVTRFLTWSGADLFWGSTDGGAALAEVMTVIDAGFAVQDDVDSTKRLRFEASGITPGTERTLTAPDKSGTIATVDDIPTPGGVEGSLQYAKAGEFAGDTTGLVWDDVAKRLGIGAPPTNQTVHTVGGPGIGAGYRADRFTNDASSPVVLLAKSRSDVINQHGALLASDSVGAVYFWGSTGSAWAVVGQMTVTVAEAPAGSTVPGRWFIHLRASDNAFVEIVRADANTVVVNESGRNLDVRIEGDLDPTLLFTDASTDRVGVGTATPANKLDVAGTIQADGLQLDVTPTAETITPTHTITVSINGVNYKLPCVAA